MSLAPADTIAGASENTIEFVNIKQEPHYDDLEVNVSIVKAEPEDNTSYEAENPGPNTFTECNPVALCSTELTDKEEPLDYSVGHYANEKPESEGEFLQPRVPIKLKLSTGKIATSREEEAPFTCSLCKKTFKFVGNLKKHLDKKFCKVLSPITCHICYKNFESIYLLKSHLRRHTTDKPYACDICQTKFKQKCALVLHMKLHNGATPFKCQFCPRGFNHSTLLKAHTRIHTGERPFQCSLCDKTFTHKHNMQRHMANHKVKKLVCDVCNKKFPRESRLKYHMKVHIKEKPFPCFVCPRKFSNRQNVMKHYKKKHPDATYDCKDTDASIASKVWDELLSNTRQLDRLPEQKITIPIVDVEVIKNNSVASEPNESEPKEPSIKLETTIKVEHEDPEYILPE